MSGEEHQVESRADAGASMTYTQPPDAIRKYGYVVLKGRACKVTNISAVKIGRHGKTKYHLFAKDIFNGEIHEEDVPSSHMFEVPYVNQAEYQVINITEDGFLSLHNNNTKDDLKLLTNEDLLSQVKDGLAEGKDLRATVLSAMGEEQITTVKEFGPK